jgi:DNA-binding transcriptional MerR regulator
MDDHSEPRWRIGQVSARTGLTTRTLRYYEELGLLSPSERLASGHRVYASEDLRRLYRVSLLRQLGLPLSDIGRELDDSTRDLSDTIGRHIGQLDQRMAALGRHRERMITIRESAAAGNPTDEELLDILHEMAEVDHGLTQRLTLLVYDDIEAVHDHLVAVSASGLAPSLATTLAVSCTVSCMSAMVSSGCTRHRRSSSWRPRQAWAPAATAWPSWSMMLTGTMKGQSPPARPLSIPLRTCHTAFGSTPRVISRVACGRS